MNKSINALKTLSEEHNYPEIKKILKRKFTEKQFEHIELDSIYLEFEEIKFSLISMATVSKALDSMSSFEESVWDIWIGRVSEFMVNFDENQIYFSLRSFFKLISLYDSLIMTVSKNSINYAKRALWVLIQAYNKLKVPYLTPLHLSISRLGLMTRHIYPILPIISLTSMTIEKKYISPEEVCLYFYYAGSASLALKEYSRAIRHLELCLSVPCENTHECMIQAYKKLCLIYLISLGQSYNIHPNVSRCLRLAIKTNAQEYDELGVKFRQTLTDEKSIAAFTEEINAQWIVWNNDKNYGLIKQLKSALTQHKIRRLTNTYATLSFQALRDSTESQESVDILMRMIEKKEISATVDRNKELVSFIDKEDAIDVAELEKECETVILQIEQFERRIEEFSLDPRSITN